MTTLESAGTHPTNPRSKEQTMRRVSTVAFFIIGLSVLFSYQWWTEPPSFRSDAPSLILAGVGIAAVLFLVLFLVRVVSSVRPPFGSLRLCPHCGRQIPFAAVVCPFCAHPLP